MPTINATVYASFGYVLVEADWTDIPTVLYAGVTRRNTVTGETVTLRPYIAYDGSGNLLLNCGLGIWWDTEPPLNVPLEYCTFAADVDTNIVTNSTFETGVLPWVPSGGTLVQSNTFAHTGTFSGRITPPGTDVIASAIDPTGYSLPANTEITMQAWILSPQGWNAAYMEVQLVYDGTTQELISTPNYTLFPSTWQLVRTRFTLTRPAVIDNVIVGGRAMPPNTVLFYIDDVSISYRQAVASTACETVTVTSDSIWLRNPLNPCLDIEIGTCSPAMDFDCEEDSRVSYAGMGDDERAANTVLSGTVNQTYPIPTSRARRAPVSELRVIAHDCDARDQVIATNQPGTPLLFQAPADYCIPDRYISVGPLIETRISVDQREDFRLMTMPYAVVRRPVGPANGICGSRIDDLCDLYTSWQSITLTGLDWADLILGYASNDGPVNPLPEAARTWDDVNAEFADWTDVAAAGTRDWDELQDGI